MKKSQWASSVRPGLQVMSPLLWHSMPTPFLFKLPPFLFCFPLQDSGADPGRKVQRGASRQSFVHGQLGEPERKDASPQLREVYAQGLLCELRKGWENWLQAQQFPFWCMLDNPGFQGADEGRTARIVTRIMFKKARISTTN